MTPIGFLAGLLATSAAAVSIDVIARRRRAAKLRQLAGRWGMNYTPVDSLQITSKVALNFPITGAATLHVRDLIYGIEGDRYRYLFTVDFTVGTVRAKRRQSRVATFSEPRSRDSTEPCSAVKLANSQVRWMEQYEELAPQQKESKIENRELEMENRE